MRKTGFVNRNKAEVLYLLKGHEPRHRKYPDVGRPSTTAVGVFEGARPVADMLEWLREQEADHRVQDDLRRDQEMEVAFGPFGSKVSDADVEAFLGPLPDNDNLPAWLKEALSPDHERRWQAVDKVKVPYQLKKHPWFLGAVYGLLRYHSMTRNADGLPQTWVSVARLAEEVGCTPRYVDHILRALEQLELINTESRPGQTNLYTLLLPASQTARPILSRPSPRPPRDSPSQASTGPF